MTFNQFTELAKRMIIMQGRAFTHPDDDWQMTVVVEFDPRERPSVIRIPGWVANDGDAKHALGWALGYAARATRPTKVALLQSCWMVEHDHMAAEDLPDEDGRVRRRPSEHPDRVERVFILVCDPEVQHAHWADIKRRRRRPPVLGPWQSLTDGQAAGQLAEPLIEAMR